MAQNNQELQTLYSELINRMKQGVEMHEQLADYYAFLNLPGYQKCHEYQMLCELLTYRKAKDMYMKEYNQLVQPTYMVSGMLSNMTNMANNNNNNNNHNQNNNNQNNMNNNGMNNMTNMTSMMNSGKNYANNVIPTNWYSYTRYDVDQGTKRTAVKDGFKKWLEYEKETRQYLSQMAQRLEQMNEREAARKLDHLIEHVEKEIATAEDKMMNLESTGYDMNYILQQQNELKQHYAEKIRTMNEKNLQFRRRGDGNYANYNFDDDDENEEEYGYYPYEYRRSYPRYYRY